MHDTADFLGVSKYIRETGAIFFEGLSGKNSNYNGGIGMSKTNEGFEYTIECAFSENILFELYYKSNKHNDYRLQKLDQLEVDGVIYQDVYIFNNATSETAEPTQKIYLNTEYGFLKLEDLEKDVVYTIVRE
jgi:hypothetical protein